MSRSVADVIRVAVSSPIFWTKMFIRRSQEARQDMRDPSGDIWNPLLSGFRKKSSMGMSPPAARAGEGRRERARRAAVPRSMDFIIAYSPMILTTTRFLRLPSNSA